MFLGLTKSGSFRQNNNPFLGTAYSTSKKDYQKYVFQIKAIILMIYDY
jgi:hypothetical protein